MKYVQDLVREVAHRFGVEVSRYRPNGQRPDPNAIGKNHLVDVKRLIRTDPAIVFDVGANTGQSVKRYRALLPSCEIHSFEPSPTTFAELRRNAGASPRVTLNNCGVASRPGRQTFIENTHGNMSSFLRPDEACWGTIAKETPVNVVTLDDYCAEHRIPYVTLLKSDTQGYDLEVLKGAEGLLRENRIELVFTEIIFSAMYAGLPGFDAIFRHLVDRRFKLVSIYEVHLQDGLASWTDALFVNAAFDPSDFVRAANADERQRPGG